jgi:hypothetical protein
MQGVFFGLIFARLCDKEYAMFAFLGFAALLGALLILKEIKDLFDLLDEIPDSNIDFELDV